MRECESSYLFSNDTSKRWQCNSVDDIVLFFVSWLHIIATLHHPKGSNNKCKERQLMWMFNVIYSSLDTDNNPSEEHAAE